MSEGYVYFVACKNTQYRLSNPHIKIGHTNDLLNRLKGIQTGSPVELCFMGYIKSENAKALERYFHKMFQKDKMHGEWFVVSQSMIDKINTYEVLENQFDTFFPEAIKQTPRELELESEIVLLKKIIAKKNQEMADLATETPAKSNRAKKRDLENLKWQCKSSV